MSGRAATIAFASDDSCKTGATGVIVLQGACTTASVDVADLSACSRRSSVPCLVQISKWGKFWPLQRRRARYTLSPIANSLFLTRQTSPPSLLNHPSLSLGLTGWFRARREGDQANKRHKKKRSADIAFFRIRRASSTLNSWSTAPGIFLQPRILCRLFLCNWGRRVWVQIAKASILAPPAWESTIHSASPFRANHHSPDVSTLSPIASPLFLTRQTSPPSPLNHPCLSD